MDGPGGGLARSWWTLTRVRMPVTSRDPQTISCSVWMIVRESDTLAIRTMSEDTWMAPTMTAAKPASTRLPSVVMTMLIHSRVAARPRQEIIRRGHGDAGRGRVRHGAAPRG